MYVYIYILCMYIYILILMEDLWLYTYCLHRVVAGLNPRDKKNMVKLGSSSHGIENILPKNPVKSSCFFYKTPTSWKTQFFPSSKTVAGWKITLFFYCKTPTSLSSRGDVRLNANMEDRHAVETMWCYKRLKVGDVRLFQQKTCGCLPVNCG